MPSSIRTMVILEECGESVSDTLQKIGCSIHDTVFTKGRDADGTVHENEHLVFQIPRDDDVGATAASVFTNGRDTDGTVHENEHLVFQIPRDDVGATAASVPSHPSHHLSLSSPHVPENSPATLSPIPRPSNSESPRFRSEKLQHETTDDDEPEWLSQHLPLRSCTTDIARLDGSVSLQLLGILPPPLLHHLATQNTALLAEDNTHIALSHVSTTSVRIGGDVIDTESFNGTRYTITSKHTAPTPVEEPGAAEGSGSAKVAKVSPVRDKRREKFLHLRRMEARR